MSIFKDLGIQDGKDRGSEQLVYNLAACYTWMHNRIESALSAYGLSAVKINALLIIRHVGGGRGISQRDLSGRMIVSAGNVTRLLDRLEKEGLVNRTACPTDRRINLIKVTAKASKALDSAWPVYLSTMNGIGAMVPDPKKRAAIQILEALRSKLSEQPKRGTR